MVTVKERLESIDQLPALPAALGKLLQILRDENAGSDDIEKIVVIDRAIGMAVMRAANSALFGGKQEAGSLRDAITRLGTKNLLFVALAQQAATFFSGAGAGYGLEEAEAWEGSLAGALAAELIATRTGLCDPGTAFTVALLRDSGKIVMDQMVGAEELSVAFCSPRDRRDQIELENESFGFDHAQVGAALAEMWGLPPSFSEAIAHHHQPDPEAADAVADIVYCADLIAIQLGYGVGLDGLNYHIDHDTLERVGIDRMAMAEYLAEVRCSMEQYGAVDPVESGEVDQS